MTAYGLLSFTHLPSGEFGELFGEVIILGEREKPFLPVRLATAAMTEDFQVLNSDMRACVDASLLITFERKGSSREFGEVDPMASRRISDGRNNRGGQLARAEKRALLDQIFDVALLHVGDQLLQQAAPLRSTLEKLMGPRSKRPPPSWRSSGVAAGQPNPNRSHSSGAAASLLHSGQLGISC